MIHVTEVEYTVIRDLQDRNLKAVMQAISKLGAAKLTVSSTKESIEKHLKMMR